MAVGIRAVLMPLLAVLVCRGGVLLRLVVLALLMMVGRLQVMVGGGLVLRRRLMVVLARGMLGVAGHDCHPRLESRTTRARFRAGGR